jgi:glycosyltransferase involved in cell wall biosynthesis
VAELLEHVAQRRGINLEILADRGDHRSIVDKVGEPWTSYNYRLFARDTSRQQALWWLLHTPVAERFWPDVDVVHCTGESYVPVKKAKLIVTLHEAAYFDNGAHARSLSNYTQEMKWRMLYATLSRRADLFHTVSHFSAERLATIFPAIRTRLRVVHNGVSRCFFEPPDLAGDEFLRRTGLKDKRYVFVPNGLQFRKNAELILKGWPRLKEAIPDLKLVVGGHSAPHYVAQAAAIGDSIIVTGFIEDNILPALYHSAQTLWFPSRYEGFGLPVLEAMACGAPVVSSNSSAIPEVSGQAAILVDPNSVDDNIEAIRAIVYDSRLQASMRAKGLERASCFSWAKSAERLHELYASLT